MQAERSIAEARKPSNALACNVPVAPTHPAAQLFCEPFSVVIPTLNESGTLSQTLNHLWKFPEVVEVIISDGGSGDNTVEIARAHGAIIVQGPRGRGCQMNLGAKQSRFNNLMFLHADCRLPVEAFFKIHEVFESGYDAGVFAVDYRSPHPLLKFASRLSRLQSRWTEFGEAALFLSKQRFGEVGGFPEWKLMEDVEILRRLRSDHRMGKAQAAVSVSTRRFNKHGIWRQQMRNTILLLLFTMGVSPERLHRHYDVALAAENDQ